MRAVRCLRPAAWICAAVAFFILLGGPARADRLPLPRDEQAAVNYAIQQGMQFLQATQQPNGSWSPDGGHVVAYAALPALTLLECGADRDDVAIKRAAEFVRKATAATDDTYDLALSVLFLDQLGDAKDEKLIQTLSLRIVAGQSASGGWGYKCPVLQPDQSHELLKVLHQLDSRPDLLGSAPALAGMPAAAGPNLAGKPAVNGGPALAGAPGMKGPALAGAPGFAGGLGSAYPSLAGTPTKSPGETAPADKSPGETAATTGSLSDLRPDAAPESILAMHGREESLGSRGWAWCIKSEEQPPDDAPADPAKPPPAAKPKNVVIPQDLKRFTVVQDFSKLLQVPIQDPAEKPTAPINGATDNSNTQFAILALWVAQRHDVPMNRTMRLIANRFETSQNVDGSWGYHYQYGGGVEEVPPMDCVGLLGMAVAHAAKGGDPARDPIVLNGFTALGRRVGVPAGKIRDLPLVSLYLLWSIERVGVLYDLPTIGDKDWYRWGAEVIVANQSAGGAWADGGGFPGATPTVNTSLALLFLRRANLVADLTAVLPFRPADLNKAVADKTAPPEVKSVAPPTAAPAPVLEGKPAAPAAPAPVVAPAPPAPAVDSDAMRTAKTDGAGRGWLIVLLILLALLLLASGGAALFVYMHSRQKVAKVHKLGKRKRRTQVRADGPPAAAPNGKKSSGKTRLHT